MIAAKERGRRGPPLALQLLHTGTSLAFPENSFPKVALTPAQFCFSLSSFIQVLPVGSPILL